MSDQMPLFDVTSPDQPLSAPVAAETPTAGDLVPRTPGWSLLAPPDTPQRVWHLIERRRYDGVLTALCGSQGRFVDDDEREIIRCSLCEAADLTP